MLFLRKYYSLLVLVFIALLTKIVSLFPQFVEHYYIPYIYHPFAKILRILFGWLPFSVGDIFYIFLILYALYKIIHFLIKWKKINWELVYGKKAAKKVITTTLLVYIIFNILWGINYNRLGISYQLQLTATQKIEQAEVVQLLEDYIDSINLVADLVKDSSAFKLKNIQPAVIAAYKNASKQFSFISYNKPSVKSSLIGSTISFMGFMGYYNPFTGEAQINTNVPDFLEPNVALHEMAHQIGYAKEDEANFVGYLAAMHSTNPYIKYAHYFDVINYAKSALSFTDTVKRKAIIAKLHPKVKADFATWRKYLSRKHSSLTSISQSFYHNYLKINSSAKGLMSYNEVVKLLVLYRRKNATRNN